MSSGKSRAAGALFVVLLVVNAAMYGAVIYLKHYNPAHWVAISDDYAKILLAQQYPDRLESDSVAFAEISRVELVGSSTTLDPRRAEVFVDTMTGRRVRVHFGNNDMWQFAGDLGKRVDRPVTVTNYERELKARDNPLEAAQPAGAIDGLPKLPSGR